MGMNHLKIIHLSGIV